MSNELQKQSAASIAKIDSVQRAAYIKVMADAAANIYEAQDNWTSAQKAKEIAMRSARKAGELLADVPRKPGERTDLTSRRRSGRYQDVLEDAGLSETTAGRWQRLALVEEHLFEKYFSEAHFKNWEYTFSSLLSWIRGPREEEEKKYIEFEGKVVKYEDWLPATGGCYVVYHPGEIPNGKYKVRLERIKEE